MEKYRKTLKTRIKLLLLLAVTASGLGIYDVFGASEEMRYNSIFGFQCGITIALGIMAVLRMMQYSRILRSEEELQIQYNKENDERKKAIRAKAGLPMLLVCSVLMIAAGVIFGYINVYVFYTLTVAAMCQLIMACIVKFIYMKIM